MSDDLIEHHKRECNRYVNGACTTAACLRRGGWKPGWPQNVDAATCVAHETAIALAAKDAEIERLRTALGSWNATLMGMQDGSLVRDQATEIERLRAEHKQLSEHVSSMNYIPVRYKDRPEGFVEARRALCTTPDICFEFGDIAPCCGPCDTAAVKALYGKDAPDAP